MSYGEARPKPELICWDCGATNDRDASECWLCQRKNWHGEPGARSKHPGVPARQRAPLSIGGWMAMIAVIAVAVALFRDAPGLGVLLFISVLPALGVTELMARRRKRLGAPMSALERTGIVLAFSIALPVLLGIALFAAMFAFCLLSSR